MLSAWIGVQPAPRSSSARSRTSAASTPRLRSSGIERRTSASRSHVQVVGPHGHLYHRRRRMSVSSAAVAQRPSRRRIDYFCHPQVDRVRQHVDDFAAFGAAAPAAHLGADVGVALERLRELDRSRRSTPRRAPARAGRAAPGAASSPAGRGSASGTSPACPPAPRSCRRSCRSVRRTPLCTRGTGRPGPPRRRRGRRGRRRGCLLR